MLFPRNVIDDSIVHYYFVELIELINTFIETEEFPKLDCHFISNYCPTLLILTY